MTTLNTLRPNWKERRPRPSPIRKFRNKTQIWSKTWNTSGMKGQSWLTSLTRVFRILSRLLRSCRIKSRARSPSLTSCIHKLTSTSEKRTKKSWRSKLSHPKLSICNSNPNKTNFASRSTPQWTENWSLLRKFILTRWRTKTSTKQTSK